MLCFFCTQELAPRRDIKEQVTHFDGRARFIRSRCDIADADPDQSKISTVCFRADQVGGEVGEHVRFLGRRGRTPVAGNGLEISCLEFQHDRAAGQAAAFQPLGDALQQVPIVAITAEGDRDSTLAVGCDGSGLCPEQVEAGTPCDTPDSFLPCFSGATGCESGARRDRAQSDGQRN